MQRVIFHLDLDAFFCSVEELRDPALRATPFVVGGSPQGRGVVCSASYAARAFGVRNAMPTAQALRLCPRLVVIPVHRGVYSEHSRRVMAVLRDYARAFEQISIDEAFLDVTGLRDEPRGLALEVQARIRSEFNLPASIGVAGSKLVAKIATDRAKPNGVLVVGPGEEVAFLAPLSASALWGVGKATAARLNTLRIHTIGELAQADPQRLRGVFGQHVAEVQARALGVDPSPVSSDHDAKSISSECTFTQDIRQRHVLRNALLEMSDEVAGRLRAEGLFARTVQIKLRWPDFTTITRQSTLPAVTQLGEDVFAAAEQLWLAAWRPGEPVRLLGVGVATISPSEEQLSLFDFEHRAQRTALAHVTDRLRAKYGDKIIGRASLKTRGHPPS